MLLEKIRQIINIYKKPEGNLQDIKQLLLNSSMLFLIIFGFIPVIIAIVEAVIFSQYISVFIYFTFYFLVLITFLYSKKITYNLKVINLLIAIYLIAIHNFIYWGVSGGGIPLMILFTILTTLLLGLNRGLRAIVFSTLPMCIVGFLMVNNIIEVKVDVLTISTSAISWLTAIGVMLMISFFSVLSFGLIEKNLLSSLKFNKEQAEQLKKSNQELTQDIKKRRKIEEELLKRIEVDMLLNNISTRFIQIELNNIDEEIQGALNEIGEKRELDSIFLSIFSEKSPEDSNYYEYSVSKKNNARSILKSISSNEMAKIKTYLVEKNCAYFDNLADIGQLKTVNEKAARFLILPLIIRSELIGIMGVKKQTGSNLKSENYILLKIINNIFANVIIHRRSVLEKSKIQEQLIQSQKLESIGNLAAGIAHDFNNLLTVIMGNADYLNYTLQIENKDTELVEDIIGASERAAELTKKMLLFSRKETMNFKPLNLNTCINDLKKILQRLIGENITINLDLEKELPLTRADKNNIEQVILNLASNAKDAMPQGGVFNLKTELLKIEEEMVPHMPYSRAGKFICLSISDTGAGMKEAVVKKIFEPFFTTKEVGKGTGMGLSVVYGIVKKHNGWVTVNSRINQGTQFNIFFPIFEKAVEEISTGKLKPIKYQNSLEANILFIEDNEAVLKYGCKILEEYGSNVASASSGSEAEKIWKLNPGQFDIVISDVILPDINGVELVKKLRVSERGTRILMISGYAGYNAKRKVLEDPDLHFLAKPFTNQEMIEKINQILEGSGY